MPITDVIFYREGERVFIREWLKILPVKVQRKCLLYLDMLEQQGHELRRPMLIFSGMASMSFVRAFKA